MKNLRKGSATTLIVAVIAILIIGAGGYYYYSRSNSAIDSPDTKTSNSPIGLTPSVDASNWKTYNNSGFNFELKYPSGFQIEELAGGDMLQVNIKTDWVMKSDTPGISDQNVKILSIFNKGLQPDESVSEICEKYKAVEKMEGTLLECGEVVINGLSFAKVVQEPSRGSVLAVSLQATQGPYVFLMIAMIPDDQNKEERLKIINTVFSTLKIGI